MNSDALHTRTVASWIMSYPWRNLRSSLGSARDRACLAAGDPCTVLTHAHMLCARLLGAQNQTQAAFVCGYIIPGMDVSTFH